MGGFVSLTSSNKLSKTTLEVMVSKLTYHQTIKSTFYFDETVMMAKCYPNKLDRLYADDDLVILLDGQLYNKDELAKKLQLKSNNIDVLLAVGFKKWHFNLAKHLTGDFALLIWQKKTNTFYAARDHWGVKNIYYSLCENTLLMASEIKAIIAYPKFRCTLNHDVLAPYLTFGFNPCEETFFKGLFTLKSGHYLVYQNNTLTIKKYFGPQLKEEAIAEEDGAKLIDNAVKSSLAKNLAEVKKPVGLFLSGGLDSSYLACLARPDKFFTIDYQENQYSEANQAETLAKRLDIPIHSLTVLPDEYLSVVPKIMCHFDEPIADPVTIALYFGTQKASKEVKTIICGEGADEFFAGYEVYQDSFKFPAYAKVPWLIKRLIAKFCSIMPEFRGKQFFIRRGLRIEEWYTGVSWIFREQETAKYLKIKGLPIKTITGQIYQDYPNHSDLNKMLALDTQLFLIKNFLANCTKIANLFGLDARVPFTNNEVFAVAKRLPFNGKVTKDTTKVYLRLAAKKSIPDEVFKRRKNGFMVPLREWIKSETYYDNISSMFNTKIAKELFNQKMITKLLDEHQKNKKDNYRQIWAIYIFLVWYHEYFEK